MKFRPVAILAAMIVSSTIAAEARAIKHTIGEQMEKVGSRIDDAQRNGSLSGSQADDLRDKQSMIEAREKALKNQNGGSLSYADIFQIEEQLKDLSAKISR